MSSIEKANRDVRLRLLLIPTLRLKDHASVGGEEFKAYALTTGNS